MAGKQVVALLSLLQLADSALPIGGFSHSWGLETWVQKEVLTGAACVEGALSALLCASTGPLEGAACALAWESGANLDASEFRRLNNYLTASRWTKETCAGSLHLGARLARLADEIGLAGDVPAGQAHYPTVFGWLAARQTVPKLDSVSAYLFNSLTAMVNACVRLVPLGHTDGQRILNRLKPLVAEQAQNNLDSKLEDLGGFAPLNEWAAREHELLYSRLFQS